MIMITMMMMMNSSSISPSFSDLITAPYDELLQSLLLIPISHYVYASLAVLTVFLYNFLECHFLQDALTGFRGQPVALTFNHDSKLYEGVVSKCNVLNGRYLATPWLASPHIQTTFLNFFGRPPVFSYRRRIFNASDGGTLALDWLLCSDVAEGAICMNNEISKDDKTPILFVVPGLTSDSNSPYMKHLVYGTAKSGWNVVVGNHRGLGGVSVTSDCFYNAGWTEDTRVIVDHLYNEYPNAPLYIIGTSIGANILVKYLGEEGDDIPIAGAVAICSPWDLLIGDRFIGRRFVQKLYDRALTIGLQGYAQLHQPRYSRLANWEGIMQSRSIRDFDNHATRLVGKYETVDTYYRHCSSTSYVSNVSIPLLCISALDDPVCTREAIPWDECRLNKNIVLATTQHGGHLAYFEGITASSLWWVRAVSEFLDVLHSSPYTHTPKKDLILCKFGSQMKISDQHPPPESSIDHGPFLNVAQDGTVAAMADEQTNSSEVQEDSSDQHQAPKDETDQSHNSNKESDELQTTEENTSSLPTTTPTGNNGNTSIGSDSISLMSPIWRRLDQLSRYSRRSMWLLIYISIVSSWPLLGSALYFFLKRKRRNVSPTTL